ncbi:MAG: S-layer homology domain-containing protein [Clostridia bacterium]|nr:S-layer homology domain-containing protein [Clostridia bacterium]
MKRHSKISVLLTLIMAFALLPLSGITASAESPIPGFKFQDGILSFNHVDGAEKYYLSGLVHLGYIVISSETNTMNGAKTWTDEGVTFDLPKYMDACGDFEEKTYNVTLTAVKGKEQLENKSTFTFNYVSAIPKLEVPQNIRWNGTCAEWDEVPGAERYWIGVFRDNETSDIWCQNTGKTSVDVSEYSNYSKDPGVAFVSDAEYYFKVRAFTIDHTARDGDTGTSDTAFSPSDGCTRGQVVTFLHRYESSPEPTSSKNPFKDVSKDDYFFKAVLWAVEEGITQGTSDKTFSPGNSCTRAQIVTFLYRDLV